MKNDWFSCSPERKLQVHEIPHNIYIQNYSTASATCLALRRWLFSPRVELSLAQNDLISLYFFWQTVDEINRGHIAAGENLYQFKAMQDVNRRYEVGTTTSTLLAYDIVPLSDCYLLVLSFFYRSI